MPKHENIHLNDQREDPAFAWNRRDFLRLAGFTFAGSLLAGCRPAKVEKAIPYLIQPEEVTPGVALWYAGVCGGCTAGCGVLVKNRDGRPIKIEGNPDHPVSRGGLCPVGQACLLPLYDSHRLRAPKIGGSTSSWEEVDRTIRAELETLKKRGGAVRFVTGTIISPTTRRLIREFLARFSDARHITYDTLSASAILDAHERTHGVRVLPRYHFDRADVVVSFEADFLGSWLSPVEFTNGYTRARSLEGTPPRFSNHVHCESRLSLTGTKADRRLARPPEEVRLLIRLLAGKIAAKADAGWFLPRPGQSGADEAVAGELAERLWKARGRTLVLAGINDVEVQLDVNAINHMLGNYGATVDLGRPSLQKQGNDRELQRFIDELRAGAVSALFTEGVNPAYDLPGAESIAKSLNEVSLTVRFTEREDETAAVSRIVCPTPHALEAWRDAEPVEGIVSIGQPVITPFGDTRSLIECLSAWMGEQRSGYELIREEWKRRLAESGGLTDQVLADRAWEKAVRDGVTEFSGARANQPAFTTTVYRARSGASQSPVESDDGTLALLLYYNTTIPDARHAHNPWLQELPDPVTKIVWDNYASISPATAGRIGLEEGEVVRLEADGEAVELPAHIQPGQPDDVVSVALGYGCAGTDRFTDIGPRWFEARPTVSPEGLVGVNASPLLALKDGVLAYDARRVRLVKTGRRSSPGRTGLACTQDHHSLHVPEHLASKWDERRPVIQETTYSEYLQDPSAGRFPEREQVSLWPKEHTYQGHHWGMAIDLTACTGCSACVVSCMAENNIPVVGRDEVYRNRELTWIRIDRYYTEENGEVTAAHQPMTCHHCDNAPCETVCPVLATVHSEEGLNQQVYNRCVGTRYCSNNCPFKVRRFNWFNYPPLDEMHRLVLNPDVTVRERGVMEKCTFCVQRIQEAKITARNAGRTLKDGDIRTACEQSCPAQAIVFGDMNDPESRVARRLKDPRAYRVLAELGIRPSVSYLTLVRNRPDQ